MANEIFTIGVGQALTKNTITRSGYTFAGWATSPTGSVVYFDQQTIKVSASVTLYAVWTPITYTVTFADNGGTGTMANEIFTSGVGQALTKNTITRSGYTFAGWATSPTGAVVYFDQQTIMVSASVTLYAQWTASKSLTSTSLSLNDSTRTYGDEDDVVYSVSVTSSSGTPTGTVSIMWGATTLCTIALHNGTGNCTSGFTPMPAGTQSITAIYSGDSSHAGSTSSPHSLIITKDSSHTTVSESASNAAVGSEGSVLFTAKVASNYGETIPAGESVTIHVGSASCAATTNGSGSASCSIGNSVLGVGSYAVSATYAGDANINMSSSNNSVTLNVGIKPVITSVNSVNAKVGQLFSFHVTATGSPNTTISESGHLPNGVTFNAVTYVLSGTPAHGTSGTYVITFTASNGGVPTTQTFTLTVTT
jgi:uncharacterized repeat protein (TIGR02543 family)